MGRGRRLGGVWMKDVSVELRTRTSTPLAMAVALTGGVTSSLLAATTRGMSKAYCMAAMRGDGRGLHTKGTVTQVLSSVEELDRAVVIKGLAKILLMCMMLDFQCIIK
jgi:hypothetical protein